MCQASFVRLAMLIFGQTRQKLKEAYAAEFAATIERAEKQIILARHGRRLLNLIDDSPVIPGDIRAPYEHGNQARQVLNDAEDDLRDWQPELEDVPSRAQLDNNLLPSSASQHQIADGSVTDDTITHHGHGHATENINPSMDQSRISSGTSVTTGPVHGYAPSETATSQVA
jgi:hypothetical protein